MGSAASKKTQTNKYMNNTPEADRAERMAYSQEHMVDTEVARKLERERNEARMELKLALEQWELCLEQITKRNN